MLNFWLGELIFGYNKWECAVQEKMNMTVRSPYFDPDFDSLSERIYGPACRVNIDNESLEDCTIVKINCVNKQGLLLEVVQALTDLNLTIAKGYISSDGGWFMDVFHVKNEAGHKVTDQRIINYIHQAIGSNSVRSPTGIESDRGGEAKAIEMTGKDRPGLFSEISAALADMGCNIVEAHAWSHNARLACVAYISDQCMDNPIDDHRLHAIGDHLTTVLRATSCTPSPRDDHQQGVKPAGLPKGELSTTTRVERRLHQLMVSIRDFDRSPSPVSVGCVDDERRTCVLIESCIEKGYSIVTIQCMDRRRLMFDTVCTLIDMQYLIFHASIDSCRGYAYQEYFIRHADGCALNTESEKERIIKCLEAAIERRVCEGVRVELCAYSRVGLLSDITRVLRENGLAVVRADIATQGEKSVNAFYVRDISGNDVDLNFIKSMKREMGAIDLAVMDETTNSKPAASAARPKFSIGEILKSRIGRLSHRFISIK